MTRWEDNPYGPGFQKARLFAAARSGGICQFCGLQRWRDGHHWAKDYPPDSEITGGDVTALCRPCHRIATAIRRDMARVDIPVSRAMDNCATNIESLLSDDRTKWASLGGFLNRIARRRPAPRFHGLGVERTLLLLMTKHRECIDKVSESIGPSDLEDRVKRVIFEALIADPELVTLPAGTIPEAVQLFGELMADPDLPALDQVLLSSTLRTIHAAKYNRMGFGYRA